jgi:hypothetical protein
MLHPCVVPPKRKNGVIGVAFLGPGSSADASGSAIACETAWVCKANYVSPDDASVQNQDELTLEPLRVVTNASCPLISSTSTVRLVLTGLSNVRFISPNALHTAHDHHSS